MMILPTKIFLWKSLWRTFQSSTAPKSWPWKKDATFKCHPCWNRIKNKLVCYIYCEKLSCFFCATICIYAARLNQLNRSSHLWWTVFSKAYTINSEQQLALLDRASTTQLGLQVPKQIINLGKKSIYYILQRVSFLTMSVNHFSVEICSAIDFILPFLHDVLVQRSWTLADFTVTTF